MSELSRQELHALQLLADVYADGGYTAGMLARKCGSGSDRRHMAVFRTNLLGHLEKIGAIKKMDDGKPIIWMIADAGRRLLAEERGR